MGKIPFFVSARAARLIGRENVSNAEGAIIELVKNCYDADANNAIIFIENTYTHTPEELNITEYNNLYKGFKSLSNYYIKSDDETFILSEKSQKNTDLQKYLFSLNNVYILDDGSGMSDETIRSAWMTIGTDNKSINYQSEMGRVRTGAKGIGRFALDRLGQSAVMWTMEKKSNDGFKWLVNWGDFEKQDTVIGDVYADIDIFKKEEFKNIVDEELFSKIDFSKVDPTVKKNLLDSKFNKGTLLKISGLRDSWNDRNINKVYSSLDSLIPPKEEKIYDIYLFAKNSKEKYGAVSSSVCDDFDYKVEASIDEKEIVKIRVTRDELDLSKLDFDLFNDEEFKAFPFDKETFLKKTFEQHFSIKELIPKYEKEDLIDLTKFSFSFYFMKRDYEEESKFGYKTFNVSKRKSWLDRYGGIKIFRDYFRVRPYGENNSISYDWLKLGERFRRNPAGIGNEKSPWHVGPNQISGNISISRLHNVFEDKSNREGLQETESFELLQELIRSIINYFERDRQKTMRAIKKLMDAKDEKEIVRQEGKKIAQKNLSDESNKDTQIDIEDYNIEEKLQKLTNDNLILSKSLLTYDEVIEEKENELKLIRALAGTGIALTSLAHEIKHLSAPLVTRNTYLKKLISKGNVNETLNFVEMMIEKDKALKGWLDISLNIVSKDKRKRKNINFVETLNRILEGWSPLLAEKQIVVNLINNVDDEAIMRAFVIDLESIFNNLIINSIFALLSKEQQGDRKIDIAVTQLESEGMLEVIYTDSGPGLSKSISNKDIIFEPFFTTREDGTGLGMWILKSTIQEYEGSVKVLDSNLGFKIRLLLPINM
ncbi:GHKL domain-containing protein [Paenibacillus sp. 5J-6]|uniref:histidine kinase n=1 Tax=Paenibacillus silvestris TaxID=2606219 RepID=A0A6L8URN4_9BACL|nr:sensor histidine kinase [Paenibacillus silvestris]MZQ80678.1 GHKL domain-containing protein [Paenibacillus silvestris]